MTPAALIARSVRTERYVFNDWGDGKSFELYDRQTEPRILARQHP